MTTVSSQPRQFVGGQGRLRTRLQARLQRWFEARLPLADSVTLTQRTVYILPTRPGLMLGATLLVMLVASINYQLNLGYVLTFLLAGSAVVAMHISHATLRGLNINLIAPGAVFAGATAIIDIKMNNPGQRTRYGVGLAVQGTDHWAWTDVPPQGSSAVQVAFHPPRRGVYRVPALTAETRFPLGTFRVWTVWRPAAQVMVYPAPEAPAPALPPGELQAHGTTSTARQASGDFDGVRAYRRGDPLKHIVWKKWAKSDQLISRESSESHGQTLWLGTQDTGLTDSEKQLSRLCAWVLQADTAGLDYGLRLGRLEIAPAHGELHKNRCLQALARQ